MKKLLLLLATVIMAVSCYDDSAILDRLNALEKSNIDVVAQLASMKTSIQSLESVDKEIKNAIAELQKQGNNDYQSQIEALKEKDKNLEKGINDLNTLLTENIDDTKDWVESTFATLKQYNEIVDDLSDLNQLMKDNIDSLQNIISQNYEALIKEIGNSKTSIKNWVDETLKSYYTSGHIDTLLENQNAEFQKSIKTLKADLDALSEKLDSLEHKVNELEAILNILTREFKITFEETEISILPGSTVNVKYEITGATQSTIVKAIAQNGWSAKVNPETDSTGTITVKSPDPIVEDEIIVIVYDGEYRTIMSTINFVTGVITPSKTMVELEAEAGTFEISINTNMNYEVVIPEDARTWLSINPSPKALRTDSLSFSYKSYNGNYRTTTISINDKYGEEISSFVVMQKGSNQDPDNKNIYYVGTPGTLSELVGDNKYNLETLTIVGDINGTDICFIREIGGADVYGNELKEGKLKVLDLRDAHIVEGGDCYLKLEEESYYTASGEIGFAMFVLTRLVEIYLPVDIENIRAMAFAYVKNLKKIILPDGLKSIGESAFNGCPYLAEINIPESVTDISGAFAYCTGLKKINLPYGLKSIGKYTFSGCSSLTEINIPESVTDISGAFQNCTALKEIKIPEGVTNISEAFQKCTALKEIKIPEGVTNISGAFKYCSGLTEVNIPENLTSIGDETFSKCTSLASITLPEGLTNIGNETFLCCSSLTSISIPESVESIGDNALAGCDGLVSIILPDGLTSIGNSAFSSCDNLASIIIPEGVTSIEFSTFYYCIGLVSVTLPEGLTNIDSQSFSNCTSLTSINLPDGLTCIDESAFSGCTSLASISLPDGLTCIEGSAFRGCTSLASISLPDGLTCIEGNAFSGCSSLASITLPAGLTSIGRYAFANCTSLANVRCKSIICPKVDGIGYMFEKNAPGRKIYVPMESVDAYKTAEFWNRYADDIEGYD